MTGILKNGKIAHINCKTSSMTNHKQSIICSKTSKVSIVDRVHALIDHSKNMETSFIKIFFFSAMLQQKR